jgi:hypothetical protein
MVDNLYHLSRSDQQLEIGSKVIARWTADGYSYSGEALITNLKRSMVRVSLLHAVGPNNHYPIGKQLELPRYCDQARWSSRNCVELVS